VKTLRAARVGLCAGAACAVPVAVWLGAQIPGDGLVGEGMLQPVRSATQGLWIAQALVVAAAGPRALGASFREGAVGLLVLIAVPLPLLSLFWMTGAEPARTLLAGVGLLGALAVSMLAAAWGLRQLEGAVWNARWRPLAAAALELGAAAGVWMQRGEWLGWTGA